MQKEDKIVSLKNLCVEHCLINYIDFIRVKMFQKKHPEIYKSENVLILHETDSDIELLSGQISAFNYIFENELYKKELMSYK